MKLEKEEQQKLILGALMLVGVIYGYFNVLLGPAKMQQANAEKSIAALKPQIDEAKKQIKTTQDLEAEAPKSQALINQINTMIPDGSPVSWFPPRVVEFFKHHKIEKIADPRMIGDPVPEKDLPGYRRLTWMLDLPHVEFVPLAAALADLENSEPLLEINKIEIGSNREETGFEYILISVNNLAKQ